MKHLLLSTTTAALLLAAPPARATVRIVDNNTNSPAPYTSLQTAINACSVGDTVYVQGSPTSYGNVTIDRRITLIGAGYNVQGTQYNQNSLVYSITLDSTTFAQPVSGTKIIGLNITGNLQTNDNLNNVIIDRVRHDGGQYGSLEVRGSNWIIRNSIIGTASTQSGFISLVAGGNGISNNLLISNNIIRASIVVNYGAGGGPYVVPGLIITNNFFCNYASIDNISTATISNNVFWYLTITNPFSGTTNSTFSNNITYGSSSLTLPPTGSSGGNNLNNTNPQFVNVPASVVAANIPTYDYSYQTGSPAINAGSDNTNIGVTGGGYPMNWWTGAPPIPQMQELNMLNPVINQNQPLNINFKARKMN